MPTSPAKLVTVVAPESSEDSLIRALLEVSRSGCSVLRAHGRGSHGPRPTPWQGHQLDWHGPNVEIELVVGAHVVEQVLDVLERRIEIDGPIVAWIADVEAWPKGKFGS